MKSGVVIGAKYNNEEKNVDYINNDDLIIDDSADNVLLMGPARTGKSKSMVISTAFTWKESAFFLDINNEHWYNTSAYRANVLNNKVYRIAPFHCGYAPMAWNPLTEVRLMKKYFTSDLKEISFAIFPDNLQIDGDISVNELRNLFEGIMAFLLFNNKNKEKNNEIPSLGDIYDLASSNKDFSLLLQQVKDNLNIPFYYNDTLSSFIESNDCYKEKARMMIYKTLNVLQNDDLKYNISVSSFSLVDIFNNKDKISVYYCSDLQYLYPNIEEYSFSLKLANILVSQLCSRILAKRKKITWDENPDKHFLFMLDSFIRIGKIYNFGTFLSSCGNLGIKTCIVCRDIDSIDKLYSPENYTVLNKSISHEKENEILRYCPLQIYYATNPADEDNTALFLSNYFMDYLMDYNESNSLLYNCLPSLCIRQQDYMIFGKDLEIVHRIGQMPVFALKPAYDKIDFIADYFLKGIVPKCNVVYDYKL